MNDERGAVRVDYYKPSGKWYMTETINMFGQFNVDDIRIAVQNALNLQWIKTRGVDRVNDWQQFTVVVAEPFHKHCHPVMLKAFEGTSSG